MTFVVRQLAEKAVEHRAKQFPHLRKMYDSVPCEALWMALRKLGVPDVFVDIVRAFHEVMEAMIESCWMR